MKGVRLAAMTLAVDDPLVERPAPGAAPTAFRIWAAGENNSDDGPVFFTKASASALMAEQEARGRIYSADFDHLSLLPNRPAEAGRASGWHKIETRPDANGEPELWAVDIEWCEDAKAGLEEQPPRWRFFSPAFRHDDDGEVTSYVNFALCINPLTHDLPSLASETAQKEYAMTKEEAAGHLAKLGDIGAGEDQRKAAMAALSEFLEGIPDAPKDEEKKPDAGEGEEARESAAKAADAKEEPKDKGDDEKVETKAALAMASALAAAQKRIDKLEIDAMLKDRADLPQATRTWCATQTVETVKGFLANTPKMAAARPEKSTQGEDADKPRGLVGAELEELNRGMGIRPATEKQFERLPTGELVTHNIGPSKAREMRAKTAGTGAK